MITTEYLVKRTSIIPNTMDSHCDLGSHPLKSTDLTIIIEYLQTHPNITSINLDGYFIRDEGAIAFSHCDQLTKISAVQCGIGPEGAAAFARMPNLKQLAISHNPIQDAGAIALSQSTIEILWAANCHIGPVGAVDLSKNQIFRELEIGINPIQDMGVFAFADNPQPYARNMIAEASRQDLNNWGMSWRGMKLFGIANSEQGFFRLEVPDPEAKPQQQLPETSPDTEVTQPVFGAPDANP